MNEILSASKLELLRRRLAGKGIAAASTAIVSRGARGPAPLSAAQERIWLHEQLAPGESIYHIPSAVRLEGVLRAAALAAAFTEIARRHAVLRSCIERAADHPVQVAGAAQPVAFPVVDLSGLPAAARDGLSAALSAAEARRPFDLARGPLLRARGLRLAACEHMVLVTTHHVASDLWSMGLIAGELEQLYRAALAGAPSPLSRPALQYADYAGWERGQGERELAGELAWWAEKLGGGPIPPLGLADHAETTGAGAVRTFALPAATSAALRALCAREQLTPFVALLTAFQIALARLSGHTDIGVGTPVSGRDRTELERVVGPLLNTVVLRTDLAGDPTVRELLARVREVTLAAFAHQRVPFERVVEAVQPQRQPGRPPLFEVMFALDTRPPALELPGLQAARERAHSGAAKFDLTLTLLDGQEAFHAALEYRRDRFEEATIDRIVTAFERIAEQLVAHPERRVSALALVSDQARRRLVAGAAGPARPGDGYRPAHALIAAQAERAPAAVAALCGPDRLRFDELRSRVAALAAALAARGVGPDVPVAIHLHRSIDMIVAVLAVLEAGGAYVPIDAAMPRERIAFVCRDARIRCCIASDSLSAALPAGVEVIRPDAARSSAPRPPAQPWPDQLAYVLYTSGTTGTPKGVMVSHGGLWRYLSHCLDTYFAGGGAGAPVASSLGFDLTITSLLAPLAAGRPVTFIPDQEGVDGLLRALRDPGGFGLVKITPAHMRLLAQQLDAQAAPRAADLYVIGGEALHAEDIEFFRSNAPAVRLINEYGPTETVVGCGVFEVPDGFPATGAVPIGRPIAGSELHVLDQQLEPVPAGAAGELYIGGGQLARGYLGRPALTAERFVPHPHATAPGARLYRTGDLARLRPDGELEYLGRADEQIKIHGHRIEPKEIEATLESCAGVVAAAVVAAGDRLHAFLVAAAGAALDPAALRARLREWLPEYMVPTGFAVLDQLPLTANGKLDRGALRRRSAAAVPARAPYRAPDTATSRALAAIWSELLAVPRPGLGDDFFALGGHSMLATQMIGRVRAALGVELPLRAVFEAPTLEELAARAGAPRAARPPLSPRPAGASAPASPAQRRLWFLQQLDPDDEAYNVPFAVHLDGPLLAGALAQALDEIARRHEVLRTAFELQHGELVQCVRDVRLAVPVVDLGGLPPRRRTDESSRLAAAQARRPFDLARAPMLRAGLWRLAAAEHVGALTVHHIASDAGSTGLLLRELGALYAAFADGVPSPLPALAVQFADVAAWQRAALDGDGLAESLAYWQRALADRPRALELPTDHRRPAARSGRGARAMHVLPARLTGELRALSRARRTTLYTTLLSGFAALLGRAARQTDLVVGTPVAQRTHVDAESLIGPFLNMLPIRVDLSGDPSFIELLGRVSARVAAALAHQDVPFEQLVERLSGERDRARTPLFEVMFTMQDAASHELRLGAIAARPLPVDTGTARFDLTVNAVDTGGELALAAEYSADLFEAETVERLLAAYEHLLAAMASEPGQRIAAAPLLSAEERARLEELARGPAADACERAVHEVIADVAARQPDAAAVAWPGGAMTYAELDRRSDQLARHLRGRGVGPEGRVAICARPSPDMVVGLLGILKAGAAYVPLDPDYPRDRLDYMLADAGAALALVDDAAELTGASSVHLVRDRALLDAEPATPPGPTSGPDHPVYVIYTSGTSGRPKGTVVTHRALFNHAAAMRRSYRLSPASRMLLYSSLSFDASAEDIFPTLTAGATLVCHPMPGRLSMGELAGVIRELQVTTLHLPTTVWHELADAVADGRAALPPSVAIASAGGEALDMRRVRVWLQTTGVPLLNQYGPTEATITASSEEFAVADLAAGRLQSAIAPLGRPLPGLAIHLLDGEMAPVPPGLPGELHIGGVALARGYLGRPGLTGERFVPSPFGARGERLYRTGDLARRRGDGALEYLGRADHQVKLRGYRIELAEVESVLAGHAAVRDAVAVIAERGAADRMLVAYVVPADGGVDVDQLRAHARDRLPAHMVPSRFVALDALPRTPNGKLDRAALPAPAPIAASVDHAPPRTELEQTIARLWAEALGVDRVGVNDNFFDLGGHSMLAVRVHERLARDVRAELPLVALFEHPTVAALAAALEAGERSAPASRPAPAPADEGRARAEMRRARMSGRSRRRTA